jgi:S-formylglutathione hydrolase
MELTKRSEQRAFDGLQGSYEHTAANGQRMRFSVYRPASAKSQAPALLFLAGLTCSDETFMIKAGAQRMAAKFGLVLVSPDTSPRDTGIAGATGEWDFGEGAGFYLDASEPPYAGVFQMEDYVVRQLPPILAEHFSVNLERIAIMGHSMGGHGALTLALRHPNTYRSVSALAPIAAPASCAWGEKAFSRFLGADRAGWLEHDASALMSKASKPYPHGILIDQGSNDQFLVEQLMPHKFEAACEQAKQPLTLKWRDGYDHSYYFISTFIGHHLRHHAQALGL